MDNYYYNLPTEIINHIESYLIVKPNKIIDFINNPSKKIKNMLRHPPFIQNTERNRKLYKGTKEQIDNYNYEIEVTNKNFVKFCLEFGIKSVKRIGCRKALKYGLIDSFKDHFNLTNLIPSCDHVRQFITYDNTNIIISSPYNYNESYTNEEHFKYNFKRYSQHLYNNRCFTYILELK